MNFMPTILHLRYQCFLTCLFHSSIYLSFLLLSSSFVLSPLDSSASLPITTETSLFLARLWCSPRRSHGSFRSEFTLWCRPTIWSKSAAQRSNCLFYFIVVSLFYYPHLPVNVSWMLIGWSALYYNTQIFNIQSQMQIYIIYICICDWILNIWVL